MKKWFIIILFSSLLLGCRKDRDKIGPQCVNCPNDTLDLSIENKLFIVNEGNFGWGNASLSLYDVDNNLIQNQIYQTANGSNVLGDVAMSIEIIDTLGYITVNNSDKIVIINLSTFKKVEEITGINSPRFVKKVGENKAYCTSLYGDVIYVLNLQDNKVVSTINTRGWTEELVYLNGLVFVVNRDLDYLQIINPINDLLIDSVTVGVSPNSLVVDNNNNIWVLCDGGFEEENATLHKISSIDYSILQTFQFSDISNSPEDLSINNQGDKLYYINQGVETISTNISSFSPQKIIDSNGKNFYGLAVNPYNEDLFVSDAKDYVQDGEVFIYNSDGTEINVFKVGIIPGTFTFYSK